MISRRSLFSAALVAPVAIPMAVKAYADEPKTVVFRTTGIFAAGKAKVDEIYSFQQRAWRVRGN